MRRLCLALFFLVAALGTAAADDLVGKYAAAGVDPQNRNYKAAVQIEQLGKVHIVLWKLAEGAAYKGIGIRQGDKIGVGYGGPDTKFGIAVYKVKGGVLEGLWADSGDLKSELGKETLEGSPDLNGTYKVTLGQNRDGLTNYTGTIEIKRTGNTFVFYWPIAKPPSIGVGVLLDDMLVVAYSSNPEKLPGVVAYKATSADTLEGIWAGLGVKKTGDGSYNIVAPKKAGTEILVRHP
ncbi:hypothetical protein [Dongia sp.]|uniref:hypothetical protein n=1 Tax=Dongia sp. TaxID=1977262 RepID=UPI0037519F07